MDNQKEPEIKSYEEWRLRKLYSVSYKTWKSWLKPFEADIGPLLGKRYTPAQVKIIFEKLGTP